MKMISILKATLVRLFGRTQVFMLYSLRYHSFLTELGWFESWSQRRAVDKAGAPIPWFTYPAIMFLERRVKPHMEVFEFGCGQSTLWWAHRVRSVCASEHDRDWYEQIKLKLPSNSDVHFCELGTEYVNSVLNIRRKFDVIVIDGRERVKCIETCLPALKEDGVIILDNSERAEYQAGIRFLLDNGFRVIEFDGPGAVTDNLWRTSIMYRPMRNVFEI